MTKRREFTPEELDAIKEYRERLIALFIKRFGSLEDLPFMQGPV